MPEPLPTDPATEDPLTTGPTLAKGKSYTATTTGTLRGERIYHDVTFVASHDQVVEPFIRGESTTIDQDRIFHVQLPHGSVPMLVVAGSIRPV